MQQQNARYTIHWAFNLRHWQQQTPVNTGVTRDSKPQQLSPFTVVYDMPDFTYMKDNPK